MDKHRIYGEKVDVQTENVQAFYDQRARTVDERPEAYVTVLLGDQNPAYAKRWDAYEKSFILPKLQLDATKNVLDIGCGMGRWAEAVAPLCHQYVGVDFSADMIALAQQRLSKLPHDRCKFYNLSMEEALEDERIQSLTYDALIMAGVAMYVNDAALRTCYRKLANLSIRGGQPYIWRRALRSRSA